MLNVEYHVSQYTDIINQLKMEITSLKAQLNGGVGSPTIPMQKSINAEVLAEKVQEINLQDIQSQRDQIKKHFREEFRVKNLVTMYEKDIENQSFSLLQKKAELRNVINSKGQGNIQVKIINEEVEEC